jgi:alpha-tubulin suppressor-like RCC1 family protein
VSALTTVTQVAGGQWHSLALLANGTVDAWGYNFFGELGNGSTTATSTPVPVSGITTATQVAGGGFYSLALLANGTIDA